MNEIVKVENKKIIAVEWKGQRVITTAQLAEIYETSIDNVKMNFSRNQNKFTEETHYFLLKGAELREFKDLVTDSYLVDKHTPQLHLWTKRGASRHCKILDTEKAWEQFDALEENYFNPKPQISTEEFSPQLQLLINMERKQKEQDRKIAELEQKSEKQKEVIQAVKETFADTGEEDFRHWAVSVITAIANNPDYGQTKYKYQEAWGESYKRLTDKAGCNLDTLLKNAHKRAKQCGASRAQLTTINKLSIIANNKRLKEIYVSVLREMSMAYCLTIA